MEVGQKIAEYLSANGIRHSFVARRAGIGEPAFCRKLKGKLRISFDEYERICGALGVPTDTFLAPRIPANETHRKEESQ